MSLFLDATKKIVQTADKSVVPFLKIFAAITRNKTLERILRMPAPAGIQQIRCHFTNDRFNFLQKNVRLRTKISKAAR